MIKHIVLSFIIFSVGNATSAEKPKTIWSASCDGMVVKVNSISDFAFWKNRCGKSELSLIIKSKNASQTTYGICGMLSGVILEGIATRPQNSRVNLNESQTRWVDFDGTKEIVEVRIDEKKFKLTYSNASALANSVMNHFK